VQKDPGRGKGKRTLVWLIVGLAILLGSTLVLVSYYEGQQVGGVGHTNPQGMAQSFDPRYHTLQYKVSAQNGRSVDVYLMNQSQYSRFLSGKDFAYLPEGSSQHVTAYSAQVSVAGSETMVLLVLDSPSNPVGRTDVTIDFVAWSTPWPPIVLELLVILGFLWSFIGLALFVRALK